MSMPLLLDTCAAIWLSNKEKVSEEVLGAMRSARDADEAMYLSPITAWEIGMLTSHGRLILQLAPDRWFEHALAAPGMRLAGMPPEVLIASSYLPGTPLRDPADRILAATAREYGYMLVTRDRPLLEYAAEGHIKAMMC
jgi:PIN domain nuclease of toxin-antitoxin system